MSAMQKAWMQKPGAAANYNPMSPSSDNFCEKLYKSFLDGANGFQERVIKACELLDIDTQDIAPK